MHSSFPGPETLGPSTVPVQYAYRTYYNSREPNVPSRCRTCNSTPPYLGSRELPKSKAKHSETCMQLHWRLWHVMLPAFITSQSWHLAGVGASSLASARVDRHRHPAGRTSLLQECLKAPPVNIMTKEAFEFGLSTVDRVIAP